MLAPNLKMGISITYLLIFLFSCLSSRLKYCYVSKEEKALLCNTRLSFNTRTSSNALSSSIITWY